MAVYRTAREVDFELRELATVPRPTRVWMADPAEFDVAYDINPHMRAEDGTLKRVDRALAREQWHALKAEFEALGLEVCTMAPLAGHPDLVFCANQVLPLPSATTHDGRARFVLSNMRWPERRGEVPHVARALAAAGIEPLALETLGQLFAALGHDLDQSQAFTAFERRAQRVGKALLDALAGHQPIDHHFNVVGVVFIQLDVVGELPHLTIDAHAGKALGHQAAEEFDVGALLAAHHRRKQLVAGALGQGEDLIDHLVDRHRPDRALALGAVGLTGAAEQQAQVVLDLGDRAHGRARVVAGRLLVDRDRRRQSLDRIDVRLVDLAQKLARIGREALDIAALALGKDRVEGQRALTTATDAGEHHQPVARNGEVDVLEVVLAGAPHPDHILQRATTEHAAAIELGHLLVQGECWLVLAALGAGHPVVSGTAESTGDNAASKVKPEDLAHDLQHLLQLVCVKAAHEMGPGATGTPIKRFDLLTQHIAVGTRAIGNGPEIDRQR